MSSGLEHSKTAETILADLKANGEYEMHDRSEYALVVAAVHAQLATAGAVAALTRTLQRVFENDPDKAAGARIAQTRFTDRPTPKETKE